MNIYAPVTIPALPGFFVIPGYSDYAIDKGGNVFSKRKSRLMKPHLFTNGYYDYPLISDSGRLKRCLRHRLLLTVFKHPGYDIELGTLIGNHKNGIKGDDRLDNLEWVTAKGNCEHAGSLGISPKCCPVSVRDITTGIVRKFPSIIEGARHYGMTRDSMNYRAKHGDCRVYPELRQYRLGHSDDPWPTLEHDIGDVVYKRNLRGITIKHVLSNTYVDFNRLCDAATYLGIAESTLSVWLARDNQPVLPGHVQVKWSDDTTPWRPVVDVYAELAKSNKDQRRVKITNSVTGESTIFQSCRECAAERSILPTTLNWRLKQDSNKVFSDGYRYEYCA